MPGRLTTHALDTARGGGCAGLRAETRRIAPNPHGFGVVTLDDRGRAILCGDDFTPGVYEIDFHAADYHRRTGEALATPPFLDVVTVRFGVAEPGADHHVPLLLSPYGYSTYRGG